jgi:hypothetical protein
MVSTKLEWCKEMTLETISIVALQVAQNVVQLVWGKITVASLLIMLTMVVWILFVYFISSSPQLFKKKNLPLCEHQLCGCLTFSKMILKVCHLQIISNITFQLQNLKWKL